MKAKVFSVVCLAVAAFAASSCRAQEPQGDPTFAIATARDLSMTLGLCHERLGDQRFPALKGDIARTFGETEAHNAQMFYDEGVRRYDELSADDQANLFTDQRCWVKGYELTLALNREVDRLPVVRQVASR